MRERYYTVTVDQGWSYIIGPNGYREGPIRYQWEAEEWADEMNAKAATPSPTLRSAP